AIITDILDMAKSDADRLTLAGEKVDIGRVVYLSSTIVQEMARRAQVEFVSDIEEGLPPLVGDQAKMTQILVNLLSNAIKFTGPGGTARLTVRSGAEGAIVLRVEDTGIGMSAEQIPIALAPFGQIEAGFDRKYEGVG